jgi:hypothetical protein
MNNFRLLGLLVFSSLILKLFYSSNKRNKINQKLIKSDDDTNQKPIDIDYLSLKLIVSDDANQKLIEINEVNQKSIESEDANQKIIEPEILNKNKWLYPTDEFGKMEKGRV